MTIIDNKETGFHFDPIKCYGCEEEFGMTMKDADLEDHKYCENCFGHKFDHNDYAMVLRTLDPIQLALWSTPINKLDPEIKKKIIFLNKDLNKNEVLKN